MPDISQNMLPHWCVVWERADTRTRKGQPRVSAPVNVRCRWLVQERLNVSQESTQEQTPRRVPLGQSVALGSYVWGRGRITDLPSSPRYFEVISVTETPDIRGGNPTYVVELSKASRVLPKQTV